jgi:hypothetical protein
MDDFTAWTHLVVGAAALVAVAGAGAATVARERRRLRES